MIRAACRSDSFQSRGVLHMLFVFRIQRFVYLLSESYVQSAVYNPVYGTVAIKTFKHPYDCSIRMLISLYDVFLPLPEVRAFNKTVFSRQSYSGYEPQAGLYLTKQNCAVFNG